MRAPVNPELQQQATAMFNEVLDLPADGAELRGKFVDGRDYVVDISVPVQQFQGKAVGRVAVTLAYEQDNYYSGNTLDISKPAVITVAVPDGRNFNTKYQPVGTFLIDNRGKITASMAKSSKKCEGSVPLPDDTERAQSVAALAKRLIAATIADGRL